jgi:hypothetical protein
MGVTRCGGVWAISDVIANEKMAARRRKQRVNELFIILI